MGRGRFLACFCVSAVLFVLGAACGADGPEGERSMESGDSTKSESSMEPEAAVAGLAAGCLPGGVLDDAATVSSCNAQAMLQVESFSFDGKFDLSAVFPVEGSEQGTIEVSGTVVLPDRVSFSVSLEPDGGPLETTVGVIIGEDGYILDPDSGRWHKGGSPPDFLEAMQLVGFLYLPGAAAAAALGEPVDLDDGTPGYVLVSEQPAQVEGIEGVGAPTGSLFRVVGTDDFLTRRVGVTADLDEGTRDVIAVNYGGYNEPYEIEAPKEYTTETTPTSSPRSHGETSRPGTMALGASPSAGPRPTRAARVRLSTSPPRPCATWRRSGRPTRMAPRPCSRSARPSSPGESPPPEKPASVAATAATRAGAGSPAV